MITTERNISICLVGVIPHNEEKVVLLRQTLSFFEFFDPSLFHFEILWIGTGTLSSFHLSGLSKFPSIILRDFGINYLIGTLRARMILRKKKFDLIDTCSLLSTSPNINSTQVLWLLLAGIVPELKTGEIFFRKNGCLFEKIRNKYRKNLFHDQPLPQTTDFQIPSKASFNYSDPNIYGEIQESIQQYASFYQTQVRTRKFRKKRIALSLVRRVAGSALSRPTPPPGTLRVLMYHRVVDTMEPDILAVTPFAFAQQMTWLREEGWQILPLKAALARLENGSLPERAAALTFDDGYRDNYEKAFPVLSRMGFTATIFPVTGFVLGESVHRRYRGRNPGIPYLTVDQIRMMKEAGISFGGHTHTHPLLPELSPEAATREIQQAKNLLEEWTGEKTTLFAYPNGAYSRNHFRILDELGFEAAFSVRPGTNRPGSLRWTLRRTEISGRDSLGDFIQKMSGGLDLWHSLYQGVRKFYR